jgi:two-component system, NarL family, nitrate/nitrite response regulator NarL
MRDQGVSWVATSSMGNEPGAAGPAPNSLRGAAPATSTGIRVLIADDHRVTLWGLGQLINSARPRMSVVGTATSRAELLAHPMLAEADIVLLDLYLGDEASPTAFMTDLLHRCPGQVLVLTACDDSERYREAVMHGARGVVHKSESAETVVRAIEKVHEGQLWLASQLLGEVLSRLTGRAPTSAAAPTPVNMKTKRIGSLTPRERQIVELMVRSAHAKQVAVAEELGMSENTLRNHLTTIYSKLQVRGRLELHVFATTHGLAAPPGGA